MQQKRALTLTALAGALAAGLAHAQQTPDEPTTVVVTGLRASLESALSAKRTENGIVDVVKAEDIGKFPDTNLAESLQRIPGVAIDRDAGEGRSITVRGLGQDFTRVRINGIEGLATTGGSDNSGGINRGRGFDFNVFASELFSSLTVRKSSSAEVEEGSLGATVDLQTMRPFDMAKRGFNATAMIKGRYNSLSERTDPRGAVMLSDTFNNNTMGYLVSAAWGKRNVLEDGFSSGRWDHGPSVGGWCAPMGVGTSASPNCGTTAAGFPVATRLPASQGRRTPTTTPAIRPTTTPASPATAAWCTSRTASASRRRSSGSRAAARASRWTCCTPTSMRRARNTISKASRSAATPRPAASRKRPSCRRSTTRWAGCGTGSSTASISAPSRATTR
ncbi:TonB-dependent receptor [Pseudoduganella plicata]|uniref:TonB-dependent receptor n=1 Tax=Pseudoduganella plicata TaxID=321984 RepID=A0ABX5S554_9BURK|nr:TonB-dependent receptor [Pseudoduganella plicata]